MATLPANAIPMRRYPAHMTIVDTVTQQELEAQFNPAELEENISVNYNKLAVLGLSHKPMQYQNTDNMTWDIELGFRIYDDLGNRLPEIQFARRFLMSLCVPRANAKNIVGGAPPTALFVWPNLISARAKITKLNFHHTLFGVDGTPYHSQAKLTLEEFRDIRLTSQEVLELGTKRKYK